MWQASFRNFKCRLEGFKKTTSAGHFLFLLARVAFDLMMNGEAVKAAYTSQL